MSSNNYIEQKKNTHLYFRAGTNKYAVNTDNVLEIMKLPELDYPQKLPNNILGLLKYNNFVINVIDIRFYIDIEVPPYTTNNELLIIKTDETIFGVIADKVLGILPFDASQVDAIPFVDNKTIVESLYKHEQETIFIVNIYAIENLLKQHEIKDDGVDIFSLFPQDEVSKNIMKKRTLDIADKSRLKLASGELHAKNKYISFNLSEDSYCIELSFVKEVLKDTTITRVPGTPDFSNAALTGEWTGTATDLLALTQQLEREAGRPARHSSRESRTLDLDLILFGERCSADPRLTLPHPRARQRRFVLEPLAEIAPEMRFPDSGESVAEALARLPQEEETARRDGVS